MNNNWLAIDPGDRWIGFVTLSRTGKSIRWTATTGVIDRSAREFRDVVDLIGHQLLDVSRTMVLVEEFRQRGLGHNTFSAGDTLKLIGALQYMVQSHPYKHYFREIQPGPKPMEVVPLLWKKIVNGWSASKQWNHAESAWGVLLNYLLNYEQPVLKQIRAANDLDHEWSSSRSSPFRTKETDLLGATVIWQSRQLRQEET